MANWFDVVAFLLMCTVIAGVIFGFQYASRQFREGVQSTKEALKSKGLDISDEGISVKTSGRFHREDYVDATQRGIIKALGASSFGDSSSGHGTPVLPTPKRQNSTSESPSEEKRKKGMMQRAFSHNKEGK